MSDEWISYLIGGLLLTAFLMMNGIYAFYGSSEYEFDYNNILEEIDESLNAKAITSFYKTGDICPLTDEEINLDKFKSAKKCYCGGGNTRNGECEINADCRTLVTPKMTFTKMNDQHFCGKKTKTYKQYLQKDYVFPSSKDCPSDYKYCGIIDSLQRKLCIPKGETCPLKFSDIDPNVGESYKDFIFFKFKLEQNTPCANSTQRTWNYFGGYKNLTEFCSYKVRGDLYNNEFKKLSNTTTQFDLYKDNSLLDLMKSHGVQDYELERETVNLYARNFIGIDSSKADDFSKKKAYDKRDTLNNCVKAMKIVTFILIAPLFCFGACAGAAAGGGGGGGGSGECGLAILAIVLVLSVPASISYFVIGIVIVVNHKSVDSMLDLGSDKLTNELLEQLMDGTSTNYNVALATVIMFPTMIAIAILLVYCALK